MKSGAAESFRRKAIGQFEILDTPKMTSVTVANDHVNIMRGYVTATDVTLIVVFSVKRTYSFRYHDYLRSTASQAIEHMLCQSDINRIYAELSLCYIHYRQVT